MTIYETPEPTPAPPPSDIGETGVPDLRTEEEERVRRKVKRLLIVLALLAVIVAILIYRGCTGNPPIPGIIAPKLPHYTFSIYGTDRPLGVAVSPSGDRIYVTESAGDRLVKVFDSSGKKVDTLKPPGHEGTWRSPVYLAVDPMTSDVYVSDRLRRTVDVYKSSGAYRGEFKPRGRLLGGSNPLGLAFGKKGDLYMTDASGRQRSYRILVFERDGKRLNSPSGDRTYVTASDGRRIVRVYDRSGRQVNTLKPPKRAGDFQMPIYAAVGPTTGEVYVSDRRHKAVYVYNARGAYRRTVRPLGGSNPLGLAFGPRGDLYMTDVSGKFHRVLVFGRDGKLLRKLGSRGEFSFPNGIAVDSPGNTFVADSNNGQLLIFDPAAKLIAAIRRGVGEGDLGLPRGVAIEADGRLYVADTSNQMVKVYKFDNKGKKIPTYIGSFGQEGQGNGMFEYPNGVATDGRGRIYVTDRENNRVQVWKRY